MLRYSMIAWPFPGLWYMASQKKWKVCELKSPNPSIKTCSSRGGGRSTFGVLYQPKIKKGHQSVGNSNSRGLQSLKEAYTSKRSAMEVMCSVLEWNVSSVAVFIVESAD